MNNNNSKFLMPSLLVLGTLIFLSSCKKKSEVSENNMEAKTLMEINSTKEKILKEKILKNFTQVNLVANTTGYGSARIDPTLINAWGIVFNASGAPWVTSQGGHVADVYNSEGAQALPAVNIPSPGNLNGGGNPTGIVTNTNTAEFIIPSGNSATPTGARFIFVGLDGVVSAWNGTWGTHAFLKLDKSATSAYTGLAIANNGGSNFLYAANFRTGKINVWNNTWAPVTMSFTDPDLPQGYSPFNIQNIDNKLYVLYAKVASSGKNDPGVGKGFVDVYNPDGSFVKRFASEGPLNSPWGIALAPTSLFSDDEDEDQQYILVGNFGDGHINAYRVKDGKLKGTLGSSKNPLTIEGLWAISFPPTTSSIDPHRLYFAAGPHQEEHGLFGYITLDGSHD